MMSHHLPKGDSCLQTRFGLSIHLISWSLDTTYPLQTLLIIQLAFGQLRLSPLHIHILLRTQPILKRSHSGSGTCHKTACESPPHLPRSRPRQSLYSNAYPRSHGLQAMVVELVRLYQNRASGWLNLSCLAFVWLLNI